MANVFFPSCKISADYKDESAQLWAYLQSKMEVEKTGCCRVNHPKLTQADTAIVICNNCATIIGESGDANNIEFVWELIDQDPDFAFPDYHGEKMTLQDCWLANDKRQVQDAVRSLLHKMNIEVVELAENYENAKFHGTALTMKFKDNNIQLAPHRYLEVGKGMDTPMSEEEKKAYFEAYCKQIETDKVVCYCASCAAGIQKGGKQALHIIELLFPKK